MKRLIILTALIVAAVVTFQLAYPSATIRYRLTLEANINGKPATGSGVAEVSYRANPQFLGASAEFVVDVRGEAVVLELSQRGTLFALLKEGEDGRSGTDYIVLRAFKFPGGVLPRPVGRGISDVRKLAGKVKLPLTSLPLLVRFRDIDDPMTVEKVEPLDLEKSFGAGVKLTGATLEIEPAGIWPLSWFGVTGEPITNNIEERLHWLAGTKGGYLDGAFTSRNAPLGLYGGHFKTGLYR